MKTWRITSLRERNLDLRKFMMGRLFPPLTIITEYQDQEEAIRGLPTSKIRPMGKAKQEGQALLDIPGG